MSTTLKRVLFLMSIVLIWEGVFRLQIWPSFLFPSPIKVFTNLFEGIVDGSYSVAMFYSMKRLLIGYVIAIVLGIVVGILLATNKTFDETFGLLVLSFQSVPSVVWLPLALLWFKMGDPAIIFVVIIGGLWNMIISTSSGVRNVSPDLIKCAKNLGYKKGRLFTKVILPASIPHIITGMRLAWAFCWRALMSAEILGTGKGLGQILMWGRDMGNMTTVLSIMLIIAFTGLVTDSLVFKKIETSIYRKWGLNS